MIFALKYFQGMSIRRLDNLKVRIIIFPVFKTSPFTLEDNFMVFTDRWDGIKPKFDISVEFYLYELTTALSLSY